MILWNFVNMLDAEGSWLVTVAIIFLATYGVTHILKRSCLRYHRRFERGSLYFKDAFVKALFAPLSFLIWFAVFAFCLDLVTDHLPSEQFPKQFHAILAVVVVLTSCWFALRAKRNVVEVLVKTAKQDPGVAIGFGKLATAFIVIFTILLLMEVTGVGVTTLLAFGGISGLALAFASQEMISNFFGGFVIFVTRPFIVGEKIAVPSNSVEGWVEDIGWYQTCLRSADKKAIYVPNSLFTKAFVVNSSRRKVQKFEEKIMLRHQDMAASLLIMNDLRDYLSSHKSIASSEKILVYIDKITPISLDISIGAFLFSMPDKEFFEFRDAFFLKVQSLLSHHGAKLAVPVQTSL